MYTQTIKIGVVLCWFCFYKLLIWYYNYSCYYNNWWAIWLEQTIQSYLWRFICRFSKWCVSLYAKACMPFIWYGCETHNHLCTCNWIMHILIVFNGNTIAQQTSLIYMIYSIRMPRLWNTRILSFYVLSQNKNRGHVLHQSGP